MDGGLAALRLRQREESRRRREEERRKRVVQIQSGGGGGPSLVSGVLGAASAASPASPIGRLPSRGGTSLPEVIGVGGDNDPPSNLSERAANLRKRRLERERAARDKERGLQLIRELYPESAPPAPQPAAPSQLSPKKRPHKGDGTRSGCREDEDEEEPKRSMGRGSGGWISRPSKNKASPLEDDDDEASRVAAELSSHRAGRHQEPEHVSSQSSGVGSSQESGAAPVRSVLLARNRSGVGNHARLSPLGPSSSRESAAAVEKTATIKKRAPSPCTPSHTAARHSPSKKVLLRRRALCGFESDSSEDLVEVAARLERQKKEREAERRRREDEDDDADGLVRAAGRVETERRRRGKEERQKAEQTEREAASRQGDGKCDGNGADGEGEDGNTSPTQAPSRPYRRRLWEMSSDEEDIVEISARLEEKRKADAEKSRKNNPITVKRDEEERVRSMVADMANSAAKRRKSRNEEGQNREKRGSFPGPRGEEKVDKRGSTTEQRDEGDDKRTLLLPTPEVAGDDGSAAPEVREKKAEGPASVNPPVAKKGGEEVGDELDDDIWDESGSDHDSIVDSDDDPNERKSTGRKNAKTRHYASWKRQRRARAQAGGRSNAERSGPRQERKRPQPKPEATKATDPKSLLFGSRYDSAHSESDDDEYRDELERQLRSKLRPCFENPKLGVGPLEMLELDLPTEEEERGPLCRALGGDDGSWGGSLDSSSNSRHLVPASINRYLQDYQREGIAFVHSLLVRGKGCILGDDMGLGKTVQIISVLSALLGRTGTALDERVIRKRQQHIAAGLKKQREQRDKAMLAGDAAGARGTPPKAGELSFQQVDFGTEAKATGRILVIVPSSVIKNWSNEFETWGHFSVAFYQDKDRAIALDRVRYGLDEVLVVSRALFSRKGEGESKGPFDEISSLQWRLIIVDEFHEYKNHKSRAYECLEQLRTDSRCPIVGMTGTVVQNCYQELWNLVNLVQPGLLGSWKEFEAQTAKPLLLMRTKTANADVLELGGRRQTDLNRALKLVYLQRKKSVVLRDRLTEKNEKVIFCPLTDIQKKIYRQIICLPDYHLLRWANAPCDCGVNQKYFLGYKKMRNEKERIDYQRRHKKELVSQKDCCHRIPMNPKRDDPNEPLVDPGASIWRSMHPNDEECPQCPFCMLLPCLQKLYKASSHAALLQAEKDPSQAEEGTAEWSKARKDLDFAKVALPSEVLPDLPGGSYVREDGIMNDHLALSGKMERLEQFLRLFSRGQNRVLIFSYSTKTLDLIQHFVRSNGYPFRRLDGSTPTRKRQAMIDEFQRDDTIFLFLISTKAGGLGLNLTAANKVIVFDVNWNPSHDEQAQDRAFRIGQNRDVDVVRLVAEGTIEEIMYARQVYKVHLKLQTLGSGGTDGDTAHSSGRGAQPRLFRGVAGDRNRKGELFGSENLLKFKDGSFLRDLWKAKQGAKNRLGNNRKGGALDIYDVDAVKNALSTMTEEQINNIGSEEHEPANEISEKGEINHDDFMWEDRGDAMLKPGDEGFEEEMGGESQIVHVTSNMVCDQIDTDADQSQSSPPAVPVALVKKGGLAVVDRKGVRLKRRPGALETEDEPNGSAEAAKTEAPVVDITRRNCKHDLKRKDGEDSSDEKKTKKNPGNAAPAKTSQVKTVLLGNLPADGTRLQNPSLLSLLHVPAYSKKKKRKK